LIQVIILALLVTGSLYVRAQLLLIQEELDNTISNITRNFEEITTMLPKFDSAIDIVLSLAESLAILENIKDILTLMTGS